jgi:hypothetical protein
MIVAAAGELDREALPIAAWIVSSTATITVGFEPSAATARGASARDA